MRRRETIATTLVERLREVQPEGPYYFVGYSFGGLVAYEMSRQLRESGQGVAFLGLLDTFAPGAGRPVAPLKKVGLHLRRLARMSPAAMCRYVADRVAKRLSPLAEVFEDERLAGDHPSYERRVEKVHRRCRRAADVYVAPPYEGGIVLFRATRPTDWIRPAEPGTHNGWEPLAPGRVEVAEIDCRHLDLMKPPNLGRVAELMAAALERARERSAP